MEVKYISISVFYTRSNCYHERCADTIGREIFMEETLKGWVIFEHSEKLEKGYLGRESCRIKAAHILETVFDLVWLVVK